VHTSSTSIAPTDLTACRCRTSLPPPHPTTTPAGFKVSHDARPDRLPTPYVSYTENDIKKVERFFKQAGGDMDKANAAAAKLARTKWLEINAPSADDYRWFMQGCPSEDGKLLQPYGPPSPALIQQARQQATAWAEGLGRSLPRLRRSRRQRQLAPESS
jgi:hypothetical protein